MAYTKGTTTLTQEVNIIQAMGASASDYRKLAGYTRGWDGTNVVAMLMHPENGAGVLVGASGSSNKVSGVKKNIGHANDGAYYLERYYFATGGSPNSQIKSKIIKCYDMDLKHIADYTFTGDKADISSIAHIKQNYFFLGKGDDFFVCEKNESQKTFDKINSFTIDRSNTVIKDWTPQGMYCRSDKIYKIYGKKIGEQIKKNYIAVFNLKGTAPNYTGATLSAVYSCDREEKYLFEVQSIDVSIEGEIRIAIDKRDSGEKDYKAGVYRVTLKN